ncbi:DUF6731 family protein [Clostridium paraputrificum]|uniref:DUF6731 family protein n=1 Tax=Clostridium paraputrificum TaxID=29363 RepID=UPI003F63D970
MSKETIMKKKKIKPKSIEENKQEVKKETKKEINKNIKFNYFQSFLIVDEEIMRKTEKDKRYIEIIKEKLKKKPSEELQKKLEDEDEIMEQYNRFTTYKATTWDMKDVLKYINDDKMTSTAINIGDIIVEVEPGSIKGIDENIIGFQLTKMRDNMLPAKKKVGKTKEEIMLSDDEYIGDFVSILYDAKLKVVMIQSNNYGLTVKQIQNYLTLLRRKYIEESGAENLISELACELRVLIDPKKAEEVLNAKYYRKVRIKGSDFMLDSLLKEDGEDYKSFSKIRRYLGEKRGVNFDITISVSSTKKTESLDLEEVEEIVNDFNQIKDDKNKPIVEVTKKDNDDSNIEVVNLLYPRLNSVINFKILARTSVGSDFLYDKMKESYNKIRGVIYRVVN